MLERAARRHCFLVFEGHRVWAGRWGGAWWRALGTLWGRINLCAGPEITGRLPRSILRKRESARPNPVKSLESVSPSRPWTAPFWNTMSAQAGKRGWVKGSPAIEGCPWLPSPSHVPCTGCVWTPAIQFALLDQGVLLGRMALSAFWGLGSRVLRDRLVRQGVGSAAWCVGLQPERFAARPVVGLRAYRLAVTTGLCN